VSWSNVRDKLNIGLFDAAHLLAPVAIASSLGLGHVKVPIAAPFNLGLNGNAITVSPALHSAIMAEIDGDRFDPMATALALSRVVAARRKSGAEPLTFGMTFPFSTHNYQLRFWMAAGGVDPDDDVRLVVLPPPYMVESLANKYVDGFCVGAPWNSVAVDLGIGFILHFVSEILDLTEIKEAQQELQQAHRLEAVGQLTGGIAHDFNNMLSVVVGGLNLARRQLTTDPDKAAVWINGVNVEQLGRDFADNYYDVDATRVLRPGENVLALAYPGKTPVQAVQGEVFLYFRPEPVKSLMLAGGTQTVFVPRSWEGKYRVTLYLEGERYCISHATINRFDLVRGRPYPAPAEYNLNAYLKWGADNQVWVNPGKQASDVRMARLDLFPLDE